MTSVFISYRRDDTTQGWASYIYDRLTERVGVEAFMDVDSLPPGIDWQARIDQVLQECDVALVLIGRVWLTLVDDSGQRRLEDPADVHRLEIAEALRQDWVRVVPILFDRATMPKAAQLPEEIRALVRRQVCTWHPDEPALSQLRKVERAVTLGPIRPRPAVDGSAPTPAPPAGQAGPRGASPAGLSAPSDAQSHRSGAGAALSAHVLALLAELLEQVGDADARCELTRIQRTLRQPVRGQMPVLGDARQADAALELLDELSYTKPELRFIRDRVEELRDRGPDMQLIELVKWFERSVEGEVNLPADRVSEVERMLSAGTPTECVGLPPDATDAEVRSAAGERVVDWRTFELSPGSSPNAQRAAAAVVRFYEQLLSPGERFARA